MPNREYKSVSIPDWLRQSEQYIVKAARPAESFIDRTLQNILSIIEDTAFNERSSKKLGFLQLLNPLLKIVTLLSFIILTALMKSPLEIGLFLILGIVLVFLSKLSLISVIKRILPLTILTFLIALPSTLNIIVDGKEILVLYKFHSPLRIFGFNLPQRITVTEEGLISMLSLVMRVSCSILFVFLMTMTTRPDRFMKSLMVIVPKLFRPITGITYRYIFFLIRRVEEFIMGLESRRISPVGSSGGRRWAAFRIGLLFSISMDLAKELSLVMESRGYSKEIVGGSNTAKAGLKGELQRIDIIWLVFFFSFDGLIIWKFLI